MKEFKLENIVNKPTHATALVLNAAALYLRLQPGSGKEDVLKYLELKKKVVEQLERLHISTVDWDIIEALGTLALFDWQSFLSKVHNKMYMILASHLAHHNTSQVEEGFEKLYKVAMDISESEELSDEFYDTADKDDSELIKRAMMSVKFSKMMEFLNENNT